MAEQEPKHRAGKVHNVFGETAWYGAVRYLKVQDASKKVKWTGIHSERS